MAIETVSTQVGKLVVSGRLESGIIMKGDEYEIVGFRKNLQVTACQLEMFRKPLGEVQAGSKLTVHLAGTNLEGVKLGMVLSKPGSIAAHDNVEAQVYILSKDEGGERKPFTSPMILDVYSLKWTCKSKIVVVGKEEAAPGEDVVVVCK